MSNTNYQLLICEKDKFATVSGLIFFYSVANLPLTAIKVDVNQLQAIYAIKKSDFDTLGFLLPSDISFVPVRQIIADTSKEQANLLAKSMQLLRWRDDHQFCSRCGASTTPHISENATVCPNCHYHQYPRIQPCIITAIIKHIDDQPHILLAYHHRAKESKMYGLIAGFVEVGESLEQCLHREVREEIGLTVNNLRYFASQPWAFPSNLMVGFIADYVSGDIQIEESELIEAKFFAVDSLGKEGSPITPPKGTIAYDLIEWVKDNYQ